ncbi:hypothetical protein ABMA27_006811 [Loxostege sticticalis]|uniref:Mutator-like transposase domain-containing protein n=1 Tax=Loxostege sticticalis TaxID=481309 RepID=A0ABR3IKH4_LOXSC
MRPRPVTRDRICRVLPHAIVCGRLILPLAMRGGWPYRADCMRRRAAALDRMRPLMPVTEVIVLVNRHVISIHNLGKQINFRLCGCKLKYLLISRQFWVFFVTWTTVPDSVTGTTIFLINYLNRKVFLSLNTIYSIASKFGRRIINVSQLFNHLQQISSHGPLDCGLQSVEIISETRVGLVSKFKLKCKMCRKSFLIQNDYPIDEMDLNTSAVAGAVVIGCGFSQLTQLSAAIGLVPMSKTILGEKMEIVSKKWEDELTKSMAEAAEEERSLAIQEGRVNSNGIAIIDVIADGCYGKRSYKKNYSSLSGAAAIIGKRTNKILYVAIKNKYCCICALAQNNTCIPFGIKDELKVILYKRFIKMRQYGQILNHIFMDNSHLTK